MINTTARITRQKLLRLDRKEIGYFQDPLTALELGALAASVGARSRRQMAATAVGVAAAGTLLVLLATRALAEPGAPAQMALVGGSLVVGAVACLAQVCLRRTNDVIQRCLVPLRAGDRDLLRRAALRRRGLVGTASIRSLTELKRLPLQAEARLLLDVWRRRG